MSSVQYRIIDYLFIVPHIEYKSTLAYTQINATKNSSTDFVALQLLEGAGVGPSRGSAGAMHTVNSRARDASRMKSATSVESAQRTTRPLGVVLRKEILCTPGASEARMRRATCESGCDGWSRNGVGGGALGAARARAFRASSRGRMSLKRWEDVGDSFPVTIHLV